MSIELFPLGAYAHQNRAMDFCDGREYYALLMEQGTGKTPVLINDAARRYARGEIDRMVAFAPSGVHSNWTLREIPKHMPRGVPLKSAAWYAGPNKAESNQIAEVMSPEPFDGLRVLAVNWEALTTTAGVQTVIEFMKGARKGVFAAADESQRIKNPKAQRTKAMLNHIKPLAKVRAIASGTAVVNSPWDSFSQFGYLHESVLKIKSYTAFKAEYAELLPDGHGLLRHIAARSGGKYTPQIVARDEQGRPKWRNLQKLDTLITPHAFRVLKKDCLDLPEKVYKERFFRITPKQQKAYKLLLNDLRLQIDRDTIAPVERIAALTKLSQIVSGYFIPPGGDSDNPTRILTWEENPKIQMLEDELEDYDGQVIIWARFHVEIDDICSMLAAKGIPHVEYHGDVKRKDRSLAIDAFESGEAKVIVAQQAAGGAGLTLIAEHSIATTMKVLYYSNTFSLEDRLQSEDRAHRIGQEKSVEYTDFIGQGTIDEKIIGSLLLKKDVASIVLGDKRRALELLAMEWANS